MRRFFEKKHLWIIPLYTAVYLVCFRLLELRPVRELHLLHVPLDDAIPFCPAFVVPYGLWFFYVAAAVAFFAGHWASAREHWQLVLSLAIGMTVFLLVSWVFPNGHNLRPLLPEEGGPFVELVRLLYQVDTSTNVLPSIHAYNSLAVAVGVERCQALRDRPLVRGASWLLAVLIVLSTVFLKQHSVVDVLAACALYTLVYGLLYRREILAPARPGRARKGWQKEWL